MFCLNYTPLPCSVSPKAYLPWLLSKRPALLKLPKITRTLPYHQEVGQIKLHKLPEEACVRLSLGGEELDGASTLELEGNGVEQ